MRIFTKAVDQLTAEDLQELITERAVENVMLEFKRLPPSKDEMLKKLSSFANTLGGHLIVGAEANKDSRIVELPGVEAVDGYKQKIVSWCADGATPPITVDVSPPIVLKTEGKVAYVIHVPESDLVPHFLNGKNGLWIRTDEYSTRFEERYADERDVRRLLDRRREVLERRQFLLKRARRRFRRIGPKQGPTLELAAIPRFPHRPLISEKELIPKLTRNDAYTAVYNTSFPNANRVLTQHESLVWLDNLGSLPSSLEVNIWGLVFAGFGIDFVTENQSRGIHEDLFVGLLLLFTRHVNRVFQILGYTGSLLFEARLRSFDRWFVVHAYEGETETKKVLDDRVVLTTERSVSEVRQNQDDVPAELLERALFAAGRRTGDVEWLLARGKKNNGW